MTALVAGEWENARHAFEDVVAVADEPEALDGLGRALWWLRDPRGAVVHRERAYAGFRRAGELQRAARIALWKLVGYWCLTNVAGLMRQLTEERVSAAV